MGNESECTARPKIGASAGLTFRYVGGDGRVLGSWPPAALIAVWMSCAAPSMLRLRSNCTVIELFPSVLDEAICVTPGIWPNCRPSAPLTHHPTSSHPPPAT